MSEITTVGLDLAKRVVSLCGEDASGRVVLQRTLRREAVLGWFAQRPPCLIGMEACASAHWFARELTALGHPARIIAPEFVRPFRRSGKNDTHDAAAICAAVRQPQLRFVAVKSAEQQARLVVHRLRQGWQEERTAGSNRLRGLLAEFAGSTPTAPPLRWPARGRHWPTNHCPRRGDKGWRDNSSTCGNSMPIAPNATTKSHARHATIRARGASRA